MRRHILMVTNYYPPFTIGGYELRCHYLNEELRKRGMDVRVLTCRHPARHPDVFRWLRLNGDALPRTFLGAFRGWVEHRRVLKLIRAWKPDLIHVWNMSQVAKSVLWSFQSARIPVLYHFEDASWLYEGFFYDVENKAWFYRWYWSDPVLRLWRQKSSGLMSRQVKKFLRRMFNLDAGSVPPYLKIDHATFPSVFRLNEFVERSRSSQGWTAINAGIPDTFFLHEDKDFHRRPLRLLFSGQIYPLKGLHTLIEAIIQLDKDLPGCFEVSIAGEPVSTLGSGYLGGIRQQLRDSRMESRVTFLGRIEPGQMAQIYSRHEILVFPSIIEEGCPLTLAEAMAGGLAIVSTDTGGSAEIVRHGENALVFQPAQTAQLCSLLEQIVRDAGMAQRIAKEGRRYALEKFRMSRMTDDMLRYYEKVLNKDRYVRTGP